MDSYKASLIRRLKFKSKEVLEELKDTKVIYETAVSGFCSSLELYCIENDIENPLKSTKKDLEEEKKKEVEETPKQETQAPAQAPVQPASPRAQEWAKENEKKVPYYFTKADDQDLFVAGITDRNEFTIITRDSANRLH